LRMLPALTNAGTKYAAKYSKGLSLLQLSPSTLLSM